MPLVGTESEGDRTYVPVIVTADRTRSVYGAGTPMTLPLLWFHGQEESVSLGDGTRRSGTRSGSGRHPRRARDRVVRRCRHPVHGREGVKSLPVCPHSPQDVPKGGLPIQDTIEDVTLDDVSLRSKAFYLAVRQTGKKLVCI